MCWVNVEAQTGGAGGSDGFYLQQPGRGSLRSCCSEHRPRAATATRGFHALCQEMASWNHFWRVASQPLCWLLEVQVARIDQWDNKENIYVLKPVFLIFPFGLDSLF